MQWAALADGTSTDELQPLLEALQAHMSGGALLRRLVLPPSALFVFRAANGSVQAATGDVLLALDPAQALQHGLAIGLVARMPAAAEPEAVAPAEAPPLRLADVLEDSGGGLLTQQVQRWGCPTEDGKLLLIRSLA